MTVVVITIVIIVIIIVIVIIVVIITNPLNMSDIRARHMTLQPAFSVLLHFPCTACTTLWDLAKL